MEDGVACARLRGYCMGLARIKQNVYASAKSRTNMGSVCLCLKAGGPAGIWSCKLSAEMILQQEHKT